MRALYLLLPLLTACIPTTTETRFIINDPSSIALTAGPEDEVVLPAGASPHEALLDEGRIETSATTAADYRVHAVREAGGRIALRWDTHLALRDGEVQRISPEDNTIVVPGPAFEKGPPGDALRVEECASLGSSYGVKGAFTGYRPVMRVGDDCPRGDGHAAYQLVTPWRDVTAIKQRTTPAAKMMSWVVLPTTLGLIGGGLALAVPPHASTERRGIGGALVALGLAIQLPLTPSMFAHTREITIAVPRN
jgi:hypothetical protein